MAIFAVFLAALVGIFTATYAYFTGHVGIWGALGLYISVGWAAILSFVISNSVMRWLRKVSGLVTHGMQEPPVMMTKPSSDRRKQGM